MRAREKERRERGKKKIRKKEKVREGDEFCVNYSIIEKKTKRSR